MRDLKQLKRSAKHFNLASGALARVPIYISLSFRSPTYLLYMFLSARRQTRRVRDARTTVYSSSERWRRVIRASSELKREARGARDGPTSMERGRKSERKIEKSQERREKAAGCGGMPRGRQRGWLNPGLFARSKWRSAVILKFSRWQGARIGLKNQSGSLFLMITASRFESGNCCCRCCCFLSIPPPLPPPSLSLCFLHPRSEPVFSVSFLGSAQRAVPLSVTLSPTSRPSVPRSLSALSQSISRTVATSGIIAAAANHRYRHRQPL